MKACIPEPIAYLEIFYKLPGPLFVFQLVQATVTSPKPVESSLDLDGPDTNQRVVIEKTYGLRNFGLFRLESFCRIASETFGLSPPIPH